jgi:hypothetical protein
MKEHDMKNLEHGLPAAIRMTAAAFFIAAAVGTAAPLPGGPPPATVLDHYLALPADFFSCELPVPATREQRMKWIVRKNVPNGYILSRSEGNPMEVALFTDAAEGRSVVGVNITCGDGCMCSRLAFLEKKDGGWKDVTEEMIPFRDIESALAGKEGYQYVLPEFGTAIKIVEAGSGKVLLELAWKNGRFSVVK